MVVKHFLSLALFSYVWLADSCNKSPLNICKDRFKCIQKVEGSIETSVNRRKEIIEKADTHYYSISINADPCTFNSYDADLDGKITKREVQTLLGTNQETEDLFNDLNTMNEDGVIEPDEFIAVAPLIISECIHSGKQ